MAREDPDESAARCTYCSSPGSTAVGRWKCRKKSKCVVPKFKPGPPGLPPVEKKKRKQEAQRLWRENKAKKAKKEAEKALGGTGKPGLAPPEETTGPVTTVPDDELEDECEWSWVGEDCKKCVVGSKNPKYKHMLHTPDCPEALKEVSRGS